jgi:phosphonate transport system permease protein
VKDRIRIHRATKASVTLQLTLGTLVALAIVGLFTLDAKGVDFLPALSKSLGDIWNMFTQPMMKHFSWAEALWAILVTLGLAFLTTILGAAVALVLGLFAARNLSNHWISTGIKAIVAVVRAIPTVLWVLIFAIGAGLGAVAAVVGMSFHTVGYLLKAYSESFEEIDEGVVEALKSGGASWWQIVFQAILPSSLGLILSWTFIRFEINFTTAVAMGAAAGAGGIGFDLFMAAHHYILLREVGAVTWMVLAVAVLLEYVATRLKDSVRVAS